MPPRRTVLAALVAGAVLLAVLAGAGAAPRWGEAAVFRAVNDLPDALRHLLWAPMQLGTRLGVGAVAAALLIAGRRRAAAAAGLAGTLGYAGANLLKRLPGARPRPAALLSGVAVRDSTDPASAGYVSAHTAVAVALAVAVVPALPPRWRVPAYAVAALVALARLHAGAHLPLDLVAGAALGTLCGLAVRRILYAGRP